MMIILKYTEISNQYIVYQKLTVLQVSYTIKTNQKIIEKEVRFCGYLRAPKSLQMVIAVMKLKDAYSLEGKL